jgi:hypothetical protein
MAHAAIAKINAATILSSTTLLLTVTVLLVGLVRLTVVL